jgi:hypothetical protein
MNASSNVDSRSRPVEIPPARCGKELYTSMCDCQGPMFARERVGTDETLVERFTKVITELFD